MKNEELALHMDTLRIENALTPCADEIADMVTQMFAGTMARMFAGTVGATLVVARTAARTR